MKGIILVLWLIVIAGCATVTRGVEEVFVVESDPVGAKVMLLYDDPVIHTQKIRQTTMEALMADTIKAKCRKALCLKNWRELLLQPSRFPEEGLYRNNREGGYQPVSARGKHKWPRQEALHWPETSV